ncbi:MAG: 4-hydroxythreonine-4-phosphate dehydrogenase PdxA [Sandaracinaceae bacterium]|nr:4-hydroxythreonine-4-phosphate dehydrogenase PdxA [Sandaracinaceae bacterium]
MTIRPLAISVGDWAGVGPRVTMTALRTACTRDAVVVFGDRARLKSIARAHGIAADRIKDVAVAGPWHLRAGDIGLVDAAVVPNSVVDTHAPTAEGGRVQLAMLDLAAKAARDGHARALVTGPTSKEAIVMGGVDFIGQTEHLARSVSRADDEVTMMFLGPRLSVALVTTHLAVQKVPFEISGRRVERTIRHLAEALLALHRDRTVPPSIVVTGLNPHASEHGLFGTEEERVIMPVVRELQAAQPFCDGRVHLLDVRPAEAAFRDAAAGKVDGVVAMMHDQATIASKLLDWGKAVNVTWGLPFLRTSVDHGVAYDAAERGDGEPSGMIAAIELAQRFTQREKPWT